MSTWAILAGLGAAAVMVFSLALWARPRIKRMKELRAKHGPVPQPPRFLHRVLAVLFTGIALALGVAWFGRGHDAVLLASWLIVDATIGGTLARAVMSAENLQRRAIEASPDSLDERARGER